MNIAKKKRRKRSEPTKELVLKKILEFFSLSGDFNGLPYYQLISEVQEGADLIDILAELIREQKIVAVFGDIHTNAHILALEPEVPEKLVKKLSSSLSDHTCFYPSEVLLRQSIDVSLYTDRPFTLQLALGRPHLTPQFFDLAVLERYRNDPRYAYWVSDAQGYISITGTAEEPSTLRNSDQVFLQSFGFGHNKEVSHRVVVVYLRCLSGLSPEHQKTWQSYLLEGEHYVHPSYQESTRGHWGDKIGVFQAVQEELKCINELCLKIGKPKLFVEDFEEVDLPKHFAFLIRPTVKEFHDFVITLEKVVVQNINRDFFKNDIPMEDEIVRADGRVEVKPKGTIQLLEDWLRRYYRPTDPNSHTELMKTPRKIRKLRQEPAHELNDDRFDYSLYEKQRHLICEAYSFVQCLRIVFRNHPLVGDYLLPDYLEHGKIWTF